MSVLGGEDASPLAPAAVILTSTLRTLAGLSAVEAGREVLASRQSLLVDVVR